MRQGSIYQFSLWVLPLLIALLTALAVFRLAPLYPVASGEPLKFRSLPLAVGHSTPTQAFEALKVVPQQQRADVHDGSWLLIELPEKARSRPTAVDFPAATPQAAICWRRDTMQPVGEARGRSTSGGMRTSRMGYALMLGDNESQTGATYSDLLCRIHYGATTAFTAELWNIPDLRAASDRLHRGIALMEGSLITLAVFLAAVAFRTREWAYLLTALWLVGNLRLCAYALGWDCQWLGYVLPVEWQALLRQLTLALYYLVSYKLFLYLWRPTEAHSQRLPTILLGLGVLQLLAAILLPWGVFHWLATGIWAAGILIGLYLVADKARAKPGILASWRSLLTAFTIFILLGCLKFTLMGQEKLVDSFAVVTALVLVNIVVALAVIGMIRSGRKERIRAQTELVTSYAVAPLGLFTLDSSGHFQRMNPILAHMLQLTEEEANASHHWDDFFEPQDWEAVARATLTGAETEIHLLSDSGGRPRHFALRAALADDHVEGSLQDITARAHAMTELRDMMDNDPLTQTLNRRGIEKKLTRAIETLRRKGAPCSLAYMDLDHFKRINGLFGHTSGDEILRQIAERLRQILTGNQTLGRIGSDEFIILFPNMDAAAARKTAERIIEDLNGSSYVVGHRNFNVRSAIGVVEIDADMDAATAISAASRACRDARKQHEDVVVYEQGSSELEAHSEELRLFDQLEGGDSPKGLYLEMQPIMALRNPHETLDFEILLRVRDSLGRLIPTGKIVTGAEESGTITIIDKWVFSATLEWISKHEDRLRKTQFININLSGVSLNNDKFIENLFQLLARYPQVAHRLCVEITEGVALQNIDRTRSLITRLKELGIRIALDDFGAGYTSFNYLKQLNADAVKIDGTFVRDMLASETNIAIVRTIVELAQNMGMVSIAEWVEDVQTLEVLRELGVDYVQGYAISAALTPLEILDAESVSDLVSNPDTLAYIRNNS